MVMVLDLLRVANKIIFEGEDGQHNLKKGGLSGSGETIQMQVVFEGGSMSHPCVMNQEVVDTLDYLFIVLQLVEGELN